MIKHKDDLWVNDKMLKLILIKCYVKKNIIIKKGITMTNIAKKINIIELGLEKLIEWLSAQNIEAYRAEQIFKWIYLQQADNFDQMTNLNKKM